MNEKDNLTYINDEKATFLPLLMFRKWLLGLRNIQFLFQSFRHQQQKWISYKVICLCQFCRN